MVLHEIGAAEPERRALDGKPATITQGEPDACGTWQPVGEPLNECQLYELRCSASGCEGNRVKMVCSGKVMP